LLAIPSLTKRKLVSMVIVAALRTIRITSRAKAQVDAMDQEIYAKRVKKRCFAQIIVRSIFFNEGKRYEIHIFYAVLLLTSCGKEQERRNNV
jgi:hypothetical protein